MNLQEKLDTALRALKFVVCQDDPKLNAEYFACRDALLDIEGRSSARFHIDESTKKEIAFLQRQNEELRKALDSTFYTLTFFDIEGPKFTTRVGDKFVDSRQLLDETLNIIRKALE